MKITSNLVDKAILNEIGHRIARQRIRANITQESLAQEAGISKRTLERIESGESTQLTNFIRVLRSLGLLERLDLIVPTTDAGPVELVDHKGKTKLRARSKKEIKAIKWTWGEDK